jgi:hypothetical protein
MRAYARRHTFVLRVNRNGVGSLVGVRIVGDHLWEVQGCGTRDGEWRAEVAGAVADHEGGFGGGEGGGGDDEVAFVFARGVVEDNDEFVVCCVGGRLACDRDSKGQCDSNRGFKERKAYRMLV